MRRFVSRTLLCQYNTLTKGIPVRLSQRCHSHSDAKLTHVEEIPQSKGGGVLAPQHRITLPILDPHTPSPTVPPPAEDQILKTIDTAQTLSQLLDSVSRNTKSMKEEHLTSAIQKVIHFQKNPRTAFTYDALQNHEGFVKLCHRIRKVAPSIRNPEELVNYLKAMLLCQVGSETRIVQTILHMIKGKVNELGLQQIIFLNFLLKKLNGPLVNALKIALPIVFESQLKMQLDLDNVEVMRDCLHYATVVRSSPQTVKYIADRLCNSKSWNPSQACSIIWALGKTRNLGEHGLLPLLDLAISRLGSMVDKCGEKELQRTLAVVGENFSAKNKYWYNEMLSEATAKRVVREKWGFEASFTVGRTFSKMGFVNIEFLDYLSTLIVEAKNLSAAQAFHLISPFSLANYKPPNFQAMVDALLRFDAKPNDSSKLLRFALASAVLDVFPYSIIQSLFKESALKRFSDEGATSLDWMQLDLLHRAVSILCRDYPGPFPDKMLIEKAKRRHFDAFLQMDSRFPVKAPLEKALGGPSYVESGVFTKYGHYIDHAIVLRPGYYPVAINTVPSDMDSIRHIEDIKVPPGSQMLLILVQRPNFFAANAKRLRGVYDLEQRTLENAGYNLMTLDLSNWESLLEYERIPFLMQEIHRRNIFPDS